MNDFVTVKQIDQAVDVIRSRVQTMPEVGLILGSGLGDLGDQTDLSTIIPYNEIPHWPVTTVQGHRGRLVYGKLAEKMVMILQGRSHYYEGVPMDHVTLPVRIMNRLGLKYLLVTNAAGALNPDYQPGDLMMITDHISLIAMAGNNPLRGPNLSEFGERFPDMSRCYDRELISIARQEAKKNAIFLHEGVYVGLSGPSFETPADLRFLRLIGADAVGMSTVPEVIVARHGNMRVLGISGIANKANLDGSTITTHEEVLQAGNTMVPKFKALITGVLKNLP